MSPNHFPTLVMLILTFSRVVVSAPVTMNSEKSRVDFLAVGKPSAIKIRGEMKASKEQAPLQTKLEFKENKITGTAAFQLDALTTGIELRDSHMKEKYLETAKHPSAEIKLEPITLPTGKTEFEKTPFSGLLKLHGVEKKVSGTLTGSAKAEAIDLTFEFEVNTTDFNIEIPSYLGIKVTDAVKVTAKIVGAAK